VLVEGLRPRRQAEAGVRSRSEGSTFRALFALTTSLNPGSGKAWHQAATAQGSAREVILSEDGAVTLLEPFRIDVGDADLLDLRRRLSAARWPTRETVSDWSQGLPL
jgi:hypothetical protein